jgi:hypothetical protein
MSMRRLWGRDGRHSPVPYSLFRYRCVFAFPRLSLVLKHAEGKLLAYPKDEKVPMAGIVEGDWVDLAHRGEPASSRVVHTVYEVCLFRVLRERLRCKEIWVEGADKWRNPEHLPADFEAT